MLRHRTLRRPRDGARRQKRAKGGPARRTRPYGAIPRWIVRTLRATTLAACGRRCVYCARQLAIETATLDHVVPRCLGGHTGEDNVVVACRGCNRRKGGQAPFEFFLAYPEAADNFLRYAVRVATDAKREARRALSLGPVFAQAA
jgi:5-methylcytosine-specific restriction endonuclease McrA